jgi:hypothetical protein
MRGVVVVAVIQLLQVLAVLVAEEMGDYQMLKELLEPLTQVAVVGVLEGV